MKNVLTYALLTITLIQIQGCIPSANIIPDNDGNYLTVEIGLYPNFWRGQTSSLNHELFLDLDEIQRSRFLITVDTDTLSANENSKNLDVKGAISNNGQYPQIIFKSNSFDGLYTVEMEGLTYIEVSGEMTIHGATRYESGVFSLDRNGPFIRLVGFFGITFGDYGIDSTNFPDLDTNDVSLEFVITGVHNP